MESPSKHPSGFETASPPPEVRRERIAAAVESSEFVRVADLSAQFGLSEVTIRSDLDQLSRSGLVRRVHGGAVASGPRPERAFEETAATNAAEKDRIAQEAASLVQDGETVIIDVGTTTTAVARALVARQDLRDVVVFTNALNIALLLEAAIPRFTVVVTGGTLRPMQHSLVDPLGGFLLERIHASLVVLGCNGVDASAGVTNVNLPEADIKRRMLRAAARSVVVADGTKIGEVALAQLCQVGDVDLFITGASADSARLAELREHGAAVTVAGGETPPAEAATSNEGEGS